MSAFGCYPADPPPALALAPATSAVVDGRIAIDVSADVRGLVAFEPVLRAFVRGQGDHRHLIGRDTHQDAILLPWLPAGRWTFRLEGAATLPRGHYELGINIGTAAGVTFDERVLPFECRAESDASTAAALRFAVSSETAQRLSRLSWAHGMDDWFNRHFCHAAKTIAEQFVRDAPQLHGRVLDIGAGDGITDLGLYLRYQPKELVAVDIVDYMHKLPDVARRAGLPLDAMPAGLRLHQGSCEELPFPDGYFDLVLSWGSVEHVKGGYRRTLDEVWRVLAPGGLFFVNPGLYYSAFGSHLGEFSAEPHLHLRVDEETLRAVVLGSEPTRIDRSGFDAPREEYWRFYLELNRIRIADFERELRAYGYELVRGALRTSNMVEYDPALQPYSLVDLAVEDAYFTLRKPQRVA